MKTEEEKLDLVRQVSDKLKAATPEGLETYAQEIWAKRPEHIGFPTKLPEEVVPLLVGAMNGMAEVLDAILNDSEART